ncbi:MAG TPA: cell wall-binding repeat-containing protein [Dermatophilaceae bacterium]
MAPGFVVSAFSSDVVHRIGGSDRYETAAKIALNNGANDYVVLASGANFPDALSSGYLANQIGGGSILLTTATSLPVVTATTMRELGTRTVFIVGGTGAISAGVEAQLKATSQYYPGGHETIGQGKLNVVRLGGIDRYATNKAVNQYAAAMYEGDNPVGRTAITFGQSSKLTALVATGENFPDALAAGPATAGSFRGNLPLILTRTGSLDPNAAAQLNNLGIQQAVVLGGTGAVSAAVATSITGMGIAIDRLGGADRYATAALIADFETADANPTATTDGGLGFDNPHGCGNGGTIPYSVCNERVYLATGVVYADALAGATLAGGSGSPILLTAPTTLSTPTQVWLAAHAATYSTVVAFGLAGAVSNAVLDAANAAVAGG